VKLSHARGRPTCHACCECGGIRPVALRWTSVDAGKTAAARKGGIESRVVLAPPWRVRPPLPCRSAAGPRWARQGTSHGAPAAADRAGLGATAARAQRRLDPPGPSRREHHTPRAQRAGDRGRLRANRFGDAGAVDPALTTCSALRTCHFASGRTPAAATEDVSLFRGVCEPRLAVWGTAHQRLDVANERVGSDLKGAGREREG
jgi:hypothetical protein